MTTETPCLSGCRCKCGDSNNDLHRVGWYAFDPESHAEGCPNAPRPAETCPCPHKGESYHSDDRCLVCNCKESEPCKKHPREVPKPAEPISRSCRCAPGSFGVYCPQHGSTAPFLSPADRKAAEPVELAEEIACIKLRDAKPAEPIRCASCAGQAAHPKPGQTACTYCETPFAKPAEPPVCKCGGHRPNVAHTPDGCYSMPAEPQGSEPPIDWVAQRKTAEAWSMCGLFEAYGPGRQQLARAYLALKAERDALKASVAKRDEIDASNLADYNALLAENAALKAERDEMKAELDRLKDGIPLTYNPNTMCRDGHEMVLFTSDFEPCPMCALKARVEALAAAANLRSAGRIA